MALDRLDDPEANDVDVHGDLSRQASTTGQEEEEGVQRRWSQPLNTPRAGM